MRSDRSAPGPSQAYLSRDEAQAMIARVLAEKDTLRSQLMELQERIFSLQTRGGGEQQQRVSNTRSSCSFCRFCRLAGVHALIWCPRRSQRRTGGA